MIRHISIIDKPHLLQLARKPPTIIIMKGYIPHPCAKKSNSKSANRY